MGFLSGGLLLLRADASYVAGQQMAIVQGLNSRPRCLVPARKIASIAGVRGAG
jgi:hypothetical protein